MNPVRCYLARLAAIVMGSTELQAPERPSAAKKSLGQNFLVDRRIVARILEAADVSPTDHIVEIGPGRGSLTGELAERAGTLVAVELDETLAGRLSEKYGGLPGVQVVKADARDVDLETLAPDGTPYKVVANLPYYAASPIIRRFLEAERQPTLMVVMVQREVATRMVARPGKMALLSVAVQVYGRPSIVCTVRPEAFRPRPSVTSAVVRIDLHEKPAVTFDSAESFFRLVKAGFSAPRKQIHNSLRHGLDTSPESIAEMLDQAGIAPTRRAQTLSIEDWDNLYAAFRAVE